MSVQHLCQYMLLCKRKNDQTHQTHWNKEEDDDENDDDEDAADDDYYNDNDENNNEEEDDENDDDEDNNYNDDDDEVEYNFKRDTSPAVWFTNPYSCIPPA